MQTLFIYGPPGSGKTTLGKFLAERFGVPFEDLDDSIVWAAGGTSIPDIFAAEGEAGFRARERAALEAACGLAPERRYTPHVTLGRIRDTEGTDLKAFAQARTGLVRASFAVASFVLVKSVLSPQGPRYTVLARYGLSAPAEDIPEAVLG